jgi:hypothetical protein
MPKGFISNFNIQHVTSCFVAGHFVAITSFNILCYTNKIKQEQLQNGFTASPYKPTHSLKKATLLQNGGPGCIFKTLFY